MIDNLLFDLFGIAIVMLCVDGIIARWKEPT
jgi:hypothetical protein